MKAYISDIFEEKKVGFFCVGLKIGSKLQLRKIKAKYGLCLGTLKCKVINQWLQHSLAFVAKRKIPVFFCIFVAGLIFSVPPVDAKVVIIYWTCSYERRPHQPITVDSIAAC